MKHLQPVFCLLLLSVSAGCNLMMELEAPSEAGVFADGDTDGPAGAGGEDGCIDGDGDGYGPGCEAGPDCDPERAEVHPGAPELCNARDDDCDDEIDEALGGSRCEIGIGACLSEGTVRCEEGLVSCDAEAGTPIPEICDTIDNDCNGTVDDGLDLCGDGAACVNGRCL